MGVTSAMKNRDIYQTDPSACKLINEGVASVNDDRTGEALSVLRYELKTFVCEGQYEKGLEHILKTYLKNIDEAQQPGVWVSGFFGSGKSHLVKMLRAFWEDTVFPDGATARGVAKLPQSILDQLRELSIQGKRYGGLHAASGTLGAGAAGSVRLALLRIVFKSVGLPEHYAAARFVMWLKSEGIYEQIQDLVEKSGYNWQEELDNFYVAEGLHKALVQTKPNLFSSPATCVETLNNLYPFVPDVSSDDMIKSIKQALTRDRKFPLTVIVLDEIQQYIGEDTQRSMDVQETVEACCKNIGGRLLFIGTGQTAVTGTANLKRLAGRFTLPLELSDADVDAVIRQVILAKKADAISPIDQVMQKNLGEISRHLSGTRIGHRQDDVSCFAQDYPILPTRRRFWEHTLRVLDQTGTDSQLRNQLSMVHKVIQTNLDEPLGHVISADYLYFDSATKLLQSRILPRKVHEKTMSWIKGSESEQLMARACGLVFLINKLSRSNKEIGINATVDTIADLMEDDLGEGSSALRSKLPGILDKCELLMKVGDDYRIQTEESSAWNDKFLSERNELANQPHRIESERDDRMRWMFGEMVKKLSLTQGNSKVTREVHPIFDAKLPLDSNEKICVWIRDGWAIDENSIRAEARQAGNQSTTVFVFVPKRSADDLRHYLMDFKAADATLNAKGIPNTPEGTEARAAMETTKQVAEGKIKELLGEAFSGARVYQGGGNEITGNNLQQMILEAAANALQRLYPNFSIADNAGWEKVYAKAKEGAPDALKAVGHDGDADKNAVCKAILAFIGSGKKGADLRTHFEGAEYGWSRDAVDGGLQVLLVAGVIRAQDERGKSVDSKELERKAIGKVTFKVEAANVTVPQRIQIRKLFQKLNLACVQGEESSVVLLFLQKLQDLANSSGGEAPKPIRPDISLVEEIRLTAGNEQLLALYNSRDELLQTIDEWTKTSSRISERYPSWLNLKELLSHAGNIKEAQEATQQSHVIEEQRLLLAEPDPIVPLLKALEDTLRKQMLVSQKRYASELQLGIAQLDADASWTQLTEEERSNILSQYGINELCDLTIGTRQDLVKSLALQPITALNDRADALGGKIDRAREHAAKSLEPQAQTVDIPRRMLKTTDDIDKWLEDVEKKLREAFAKGPVVIR